MSTSIDIASTVPSRITLFFGNKPLGMATGFFYRNGTEVFLITNWHVVSGRDFQDLKPVRNDCALPDRITFTVTCRGHVQEWKTVERTLYEDADSCLPGAAARPVWLEHVVHRRKVDVVAIPVTIPDDAKVTTIDNVNTVPKMLLRVSTDVFVLGYPKGISGGGEFPIWKRGSIANEPYIELGLPMMLIDTATREGMSGAPVIALADGEFDVEGLPPAYRKPGRVYRFVGVYSGRLGHDEMQAQLGMVWKARVVDEIVQAPTKGRSSFLLPDSAS